MRHCCYRLPGLRDAAWRSHGPTSRPGGDEDGHVTRDRLTAELAAERAKLGKQQDAVKATERRIATLTRKLGGKTTGPLDDLKPKDRCRAWLSGPVVSHA